MIETIESTVENGQVLPKIVTQFLCANCNHDIPDIAATTCPNCNAPLTVAQHADVHVMMMPAFGSVNI